MQLNQVFYLEKVAEKVQRNIHGCEEKDFKTQVINAFDGEPSVVISDNYLESSKEYTVCPVHVFNRDDITLNIGLVKENGKISVVRTFVSSSIDALVDPKTFSKVIHVSHDDLDGESPLILSRIAFADYDLITRGCSHDKIDEIVMSLIQDEMKKEDTIMFITDISVNPENLREIHELVKQGYRIFIIDHHDAKPDVPINRYSQWLSINITYPDGRGTAATSMYYEFLVKHQLINPTALMNDYVELVRLYDTWEWDDSENLRAKRLNDYFFMSNREEFGQQVLQRLTDVEVIHESNSLHEAGFPLLFQFEGHIEYMLDMEQKRIEDYCKKKKKQIQLFKGFVDDSDRIYTYGVVFADSYQSELGNYLCKELIEEMDFVVMLDAGSKKMSLRCNKHKDIDVGAIARSLDGGGRKATAGCPLNVRTKYLFLDQLLTKTLA